MMCVGLIGWHLRAPPCAPISCANDCHLFVWRQQRSRDAFRNNPNAKSSQNWFGGMVVMVDGVLLVGIAIKICVCAMR